MTITEQICNDKVDDAKLNQLEIQLQNKLPGCYRKFLKNNNGGRPEPSQFDFTSKGGSKERSKIQYFFAVYEGRIGNLFKKYNLYYGRIPKNHLPIATDSFGNLILIPMGNQSDVPVYFWDHERESEDGLSFENLCLISNSFEKFINDLHSC